MERLLECKQGIAFISMYSTTMSNESYIMGSLTNAVYDYLPPSIILNKAECKIIPNEDSLLEYDIIDSDSYEWECELKLDIMSKNSICLRLYVICSCGHEGDTIGFKIEQDELIRLAKKYLVKE